MAILQEGPEFLWWCDQCGMHIHAARLFKYWQSEKCHKSTERRLHPQDVEMAASCEEMEFKIDVDKGDERVENVTTLQYLGQTLHQMSDDWPAVCRNIMRKRSVWGRIWTLLQREVTDPKVLSSFYRAVVQAIQLFGSETWAL